MTPDAPEVLVATILHATGTTGVHTHFTQLRQHLDSQGISSRVVTPFSWGMPFTAPVFAVRLGLQHPSTAAGVVWYRYWHGAFLAKALKRELRSCGPVVIYAQEPVAAQAALRARSGPHQKVVMAVHFPRSQADEWARKKLIVANGRVYKAIQDMEREVICSLDGIIYVSHSARRELLEWMPEACAVPSVVV
ncbi:MAG TPA: glycosyltransferase family 4 protein, partial [Acidimicrobiales bacterium]|nr:glycosyltransferase family 4 protein [Acidimicrobiales bacterium]